MEINYSFDNLTDLIKHAENYKYRRKRQRTSYSDHLRKEQQPQENLIPHNVDMERLIYCIEPLKKLNKLIGMDELKKNVVDQILFFSQDLNTNEMMHTCLTGPPGVGKTTLGKILAELYCSLGILETDNFKIVSAPELIAGYVGQTSLKTNKVLKGSIGGVLFIDEAYSLGSTDLEGYSKECIDTINKFLSENTKNFIMIIAGYQDELDKCFFSLNKGLRRRFPWVYNIEKYTTDNLGDIFRYQVYENGWELDESINTDFMKKIFSEYPIFDNNGGDTLLLFDKAKICHSRRVFGKKRKYKMVLNNTDIRLAAELLKSHKQKGKLKDPPYGMYL